MGDVILHHIKHDMVMVVELRFRTLLYIIQLSVGYETDVKLNIKHKQLNCFMQRRFA